MLVVIGGVFVLVGIAISSVFRIGFSGRGSFEKVVGCLLAACSLIALACHLAYIILDLKSAGPAAAPAPPRSQRILVPLCVFFSVATAALIAFP